MIHDKGTVTPTIVAPPTRAARAAGSGSSSSPIARVLGWLWDRLSWRRDSAIGAPAAPAGAHIRPGTKVATAQGFLGVVDRVLPDPVTAQVTHFVLRQGAPGSKRVVVPAAWAAKVTPATVHLAVDRAQVHSLPEYRPDHELTAAVLTALRAHPRLRRVLRGIISFAPPFSHPRREWAIRVRVAQGIVTLEGHVPAHGFGHMAAQIAGRIPGVRQVRDWLVADDDLQVAVAVALGRDPRTRAVQPRVRVDSGRVTLIGRAPDEPTRAAAGAVAAAVPGVRGVANQLRRAI
jgi:hypothetical protein